MSILGKYGIKMGIILAAAKSFVFTQKGKLWFTHKRKQHLILIGVFQS